MLKGEHHEQEVISTELKDSRASLGSDSKESACRPRDLGSIPGSGSPLEKGMATPSSIFAWGIPWTEEPGGL